MTFIIADTLACLKDEDARQYGIPVIPQIINFEGKSYREGIDVDYETFLDWIRAAKVLPQTAAPPPELFAAEFEKLKGTNEPILCIHPSAEISGTIRSVTVAKQDFPELDIRIVDTQLIAAPLGSLVLMAARWAAEGISADEIELRLAAWIPRARIYFLVATLDYLARGGRIGGANALLGSLLQIKPILTIRDGKVDVYERDRTHKRALAHIKKLALDQSAPGDGGCLTVMHAGALGEAHQLAKELKQELGLSEVPVTLVPPAIVTHGGPGVIAVAFFSPA